GAPSGTGPTAVSARSRARCRSRLRTTTGAAAASSSGATGATWCCGSIGSARAAAPGSCSTCTSMSPAIRRLAASHRQRGTIRDRAALHLLGQLEQNPGRRFGMQERDAAAIGAAAGLLVDQTVAGRPAALERPVEIGHAVADVMDARSASSEELRHGALGVARLEQLDLNVAQREADDRSAIRGFRLPC